jgi:hypothetical protein
MENALADERPESRVYVMNDNGNAANSIGGFMHVVVEGGAADIRLNAVRRGGISGLARPGFNLYVATLRRLQNEGVDSVQTRVAASNVAALNIYSGLGCRFASPEAVFHWWADPAA